MIALVKISLIKNETTGYPFGVFRNILYALIRL